MHGETLKLATDVLSPSAEDTIPFAQTPADFSY